MGVMRHMVTNGTSVTWYLVTVVIVTDEIFQVTATFSTQDCTHVHMFNDRTVLVVQVPR